MFISTIACNEVFALYSLVVVELLSLVCVGQHDVTLARKIEWDLSG